MIMITFVFDCDGKNNVGVGRCGSDGLCLFEVLRVSGHKRSFFFQAPKQKTEKQPAAHRKNLEEPR